jgi:SAM-dependent methyltransferase
LRRLVRAVFSRRARRRLLQEDKDRPDVPPPAFPTMIFETPQGAPAVICPLSGSPDLDLIERIDPTDLIRIFYTAFGMDLRPLFHGVDEIALLRSRVSDLVFFHPMITGDAAFYAGLSRHPWYYDERRSEFAPAAQWIKPTDRVLEVGCGFGHFAVGLSCADYLGLEFNPRALAACRERGVAVCDRSVEDESERSGAVYDAVCAFQVLEHVESPSTFLDACARALRPGGRLILSVPSADSYMRHATNDVLNLPPHHVTRWSDLCLRRLENLFPVRLLELRHDKLSDGDHRRVYLKTLIVAAYCRERFGREPRTVDIAPAFLALQDEAAALSRTLEQGFLSPAMDAHGHTVLAVYEKTA